MPLSDRGLSAQLDAVLAAALPRVITCLESDSKTDITNVGDGLLGVEDFASMSAPATPRERNIWEDVLPAASSKEAEDEVEIARDATLLMRVG